MRAMPWRVLGSITGETCHTVPLNTWGMFVAATHRGAAHGVAAALLQTLTAWTRERGVREVFLGTTAQYLAAHRFYEKNGFRQIPKDRLPPNFPVMSVDTRFYTRAVTAGVSPSGGSAP